MLRELKIERNKSGIGRQAHAASALRTDAAITAARGVMWRPNAHKSDPSLNAAFTDSGTVANPWHNTCSPPYQTT